MKIQNTNLAFTKHAVTELNDDQLLNIKGGSMDAIVEFTIYILNRI